MSSVRLPLAPVDGSPSVVTPCPMVAASFTRRDFVSTATLGVLASALAAACGGGDATEPGGGTATPAAGLAFANGTLTIALASFPELTRTDGFLLTNPAGGVGRDVRDASGRRADAIVIATGANQWRAFTSICTHQQNPIGGYSNGRMQCFFHGSQFNTSGQNVVGPSGGAANLRALTEYPVTFDATARTLTIRVA